MKMRSLLALGLVWLCSLASAASPPDPADARCEWLLGLHLKMMPAKDLPIVRVPIASTQRTGEKPHMVYTLGFLESDDGKNYVVRRLDLHRMKGLHSTWSQTDAESAKALPKLTTSEAATFWCDWLDDTDSHRDLDSRLSYGRYAQAFTQCIIFAAALYERGDFVASHLLHQRARQMPRRLAEGPATKDFQHDLREDLAHALFKGAEDDVGDPTQRREDLLKRLEEIIRCFPNTVASSNAETMASALRPVIAQAAQPKLSDAEFAKLPVKERVAALIRQLPDQTGRQMMSPGICDVFADEQGWGFGGGVSYMTFGYAQSGGLVYGGGPAITPAGKLAEIGMEAVPQLIKAIDDQRPTRASGSGIPLWQRSSVLDVGDCAIQILQRLSNRSFTDNNLSRSPDAARTQIKANAQGWWKEVQDGTEADTLDRKISAGEEGEPNLAARLIKIDPARAVAAMERGMNKTEKPWSAKWLLTPLSTIDSDAARQLIFRQVTEGRFLSVRIQAAQLVWQAPTRADGTPLFSAEEQRRAREAMLAEWRRFPPPKERLEPFDGYELAEALGSLATKTPELLEAVATDLEKQSPNIRVKLMETLAERTRGPANPPKPPMDAILEKFLVGQLEDTAFSTKARFERAGKAYCEGARVTEYAAAQLARLWPERYHFTWDASGDEMETARLACLNAWRASQKQPPLPATAPSLPPGQDSATVVRVALGKDSLPLEGEWPKWVHSLEGKTLAGEDFVSLLVAHAEQNTEDKQSIRLTAYRQSARSGFVVELSLGRELEPTANGCHRLDVIVNGRPFMGESGGLELHLARK